MFRSRREPCLESWAGRRTSVHTVLLHLTLHISARTHNFFSGALPKPTEPETISSFSIDITPPGRRAMIQFPNTRARVKFFVFFFFFFVFFFFFFLFLFPISRARVKCQVSYHVITDVSSFLSPFCFITSCQGCLLSLCVSLSLNPAAKRGLFQSCTSRTAAARPCSCAVCEDGCTCAPWLCQDLVMRGRRRTRGRERERVEGRFFWVGLGVGLQVWGTVAYLGTLPRLY